ncbi:Imm26 family immunity protein [Flavobacterium johnsoniae]|jgi:hypothetical protein|uniref:Imm26 family immunity protein n=1 Tax=Flavobacterium johnsoniae TaxID=986 RepID=UPI0011ECC880|nr:Imm26 family immunity protein [Flavobacterium johnsoniae]
MHKIQLGSIIEIELADSQFAYGCKFDSIIVGIYKIISSNKLQISDIILNQISVYIAIDNSYLKKRPFKIIGKINLLNDEIYPPDLAWYAEWLPEDSLKRSTIRNKKGKTEYTNKEYYISLVKKGLVMNVFNRPEYLSLWLIDNLNNWPNYEIPLE